MCVVSGGDGELKMSIEEDIVAMMVKTYMSTG